MRPEAPWDVLHVDLADPAPVALSAGAQAAQIYFRRDGVVAGEMRLPRSAFPLSGAQLRQAGLLAATPVIAALTAGPGYARRAAPPPAGVTPPVATASAAAGGPPPLEAFDRLVAARRARSAHSVTVAICTLRRPRQLADCLTAVKAAFGGGPGREILVVDNGPDPETRAVVEAAGARYVVEQRRGLSNARNAALAASEAEVVAFVDDDVFPEPGWLEPLLHAFDDPSVGVATGLALPAWLKTNSQISFQMDLGFAGMHLTPVRFDEAFVAATAARGVPSWEFGAGANMAVRRSLLGRIGGFDGRLGPGAAGGAGDDSEFWRRLLEAGFAGQYEPFSVVRHEHRESWAELDRQAVGYALGHVAALFAQYGNHRRAGDLYRAFWVMPAWYAKRVLLSGRRRMLGIPDHHLKSELTGYLRGLRHIGFVRGGGQTPALPPSAPPAPQAAEGPQPPRERASLPD